MRFFALGTVGRTIFTFRFSSCRLVLWRRDSQRGIHTHSTGVHIPTHTHTSPHAGACEFGGAICPLYALRTEAGGLRIGWEGLVAADKSIKRARKCCYTPPLSTRLDCCCHTHTQTRTPARNSPACAHIGSTCVCVCVCVWFLCVCVLSTTMLYFSQENITCRHSAPLTYAQGPAAHNTTHTRTQSTSTRYARVVSACVCVGLYVLWRACAPNEMARRPHLNKHTRWESELNEWADARAQPKQQRPSGVA